MECVDFLLGVFILCPENEFSGFKISFQLDTQNRVDELCSILDGGPMGLSLSTQSLASSSSAISPEMEILLRNQQTLLKQIADSKSQVCCALPFPI